MEPVTVYLDILFLVNLTVDYFLLSAVALLRRINRKKIRLLLGAAAGSLYSSFVFFTPLSFAFTLPFKILASAFMVLISFEHRKISSFFKNLICMHIVSIGFGGLIMGAELLFSPRNLLVSNGEFYINISVLTLIIASSVAYISMLVFSRFLTPLKKQGLHKITVTVDGKTTDLTALYDSGNQLTDKLTGAKVIVASKNAVVSIMPEDVRRVFSADLDMTYAAETSWNTRICMIPYHTLSGNGLLAGFRPDRVTIDGEMMEQRAVIAVKDGEINEKYQAIVGNIL